MPVCYNHASMMICKKIISTITAAAAAVALFTVSVPVALAGSDNASRKAITSSRSFPKMNTARKDLLKEIVSVSSDDSESWGGVESLNVPETKSTAEKKAEEEAKKAEEERKAAEKAAAEASRLQAAEVSRSRASAATSSTSSSSVSNDVRSMPRSAPMVPAWSPTPPSSRACPMCTAAPRVGIRLLGLHAVRVLQVRHQPAAYRLSAACVGSGSRHEGQRSPAGDLMWRSGHVGIYVGTV